MATAIPLFAGKEITASEQDIARQAAGEWISVGVSVTEASGDDSALSFGVEWSFDGATWAVAQPDNTIGTLAGPGSIVQRFTVKAIYWRLVTEVTGTDPRFLCTANALI